MIYKDEIVEEVRRHREELAEEYPTFEAYRKHCEERRPQLEKEGWKFVTLEEVLAKGKDQK
ncbi:hypothetical protein FACS1894200_00230 [Spirochaetia bacterium]|nr:hypothetical protein FACS1894200_00230 [Spirochaetia bacterium]